MAMSYSPLNTEEWIENIAAAKENKKRGCSFKLHTYESMNLETDPVTTCASGSLCPSIQEWTGLN